MSRELERGKKHRFLLQVLVSEWVEHSQQFGVKVLLCQYHCLEAINIQRHSRIKMYSEYLQKKLQVPLTLQQRFSISQCS